MLPLLQVGMAPFLLLEAGTIPAYGLGWLDIWNGLDLLTYCIQVGVRVGAVAATWGRRKGGGLRGDGAGQGGAGRGRAGPRGNW